MDTQAANRIWLPTQPWVCNLINLYIRSHLYTTAETTNYNNPPHQTTHLTWKQTNISTCQYYTYMEITLPIVTALHHTWKNTTKSLAPEDGHKVARNMLRNKYNTKWHLVGFLFHIALLVDSNVNTKETEKLSKYKDLEIKVSRMWKVMTKIVPVITGALGTIKKALDQKLQLLPGHRSAIELQKITLMSTAQSNCRVLGEVALICCWNLDLQRPIPYRWE